MNAYNIQDFTSRESEIMCVWALDTGVVPVFGHAS